MQLSQNKGNFHLDTIKKWKEKKEKKTAYGMDKMLQIKFN